MTDPLRVALLSAAEIIASRTVLEHEIKEAAERAAVVIEEVAREKARQNRRAMWIEPRMGRKGQVIDSSCTHRPIAYVVKRKGD